MKVSQGVLQSNSVILHSVAPGKREKAYDIDFINDTYFLITPSEGEQMLVFPTNCVYAIPEKRIEKEKAKK